MKGLNLTISILIPTTLVLFIVAGVLNAADSLSGLHLTQYDIILLSCIFGISKTLFDTANVALDRDKELTKVFVISYKLKHALRWSGWLFAGVLIFGVNSDVNFFGVSVYALHLIFTALAIINSYIIVLLYPDEKKERHISYVQTAFGAIGFGLGFFLNLYSVTWAEFLAAVPIAYTIYKIIYPKVN